MAEILHDVDFDKIDSPIAPLGKWIKRAPYIVAPEHEADLVEIQKKHNIRLRLDATDHSFCVCAGAERDEKYIRLGLALLERVWAYCYGFTAIVEIVKKAEPGTLVELKNFPEAALAWKFLRWAYAGEREKVRFAWERDFPRPSSKSADPYVENTDKFFAMVVGFFVLHEIGHIALEHPFDLIPTSQAIIEELAADAFAADMMLDRCPREAELDKQFVARANAVATGLTLLSGVEIKGPEEQPRDHPKVPERLLHFFAKHIPESKERAPVQEYPMYFSSIVLQAFALNAGIEFPYYERHSDFMTFFVKACQAFP